MEKCTYKWMKWNEEKNKLIKTECPEETWTSPEKYCIFHNPSQEKDVKLFKLKLKEKLDKKDYIFVGYCFPKKVNFRNWTFQKDADFSEATFQKDADFSEATFQKDADFSEATFQKDADFKGAIFKKDADFSEATFQKDANFFRVTFQDANFSRATFKNTSFSGVTFQDADFKGAIFKNSSFSGSRFQKDANFSKSTFQEDANFSEATFQKNANFIGAIFQDAYFRGIIFQEDADFFGVRFQKNADFIKTTFKNANFMEATFQDANFMEATFQDDVDLSEATFQDANFKGVTFQDDANFTRATFKNVSFCRAVIERNLEFAPIKVKELNLQKAQFLSKGHIAANLDKAKFHQADLENLVFSDFEWPKKIYEEANMEEGLSCKELETIYRNLKQNMQRHGDYSKAGDFYYREMEMKRKRTKNFRRLRLEIYRFMTGYGERPQNVAIFAVLVILIFALLYYELGCMQYQHLVGDPTLIQQTKDAIYFSFVTFTTLGLGDIHPANDIGKVLVCCEAVLGLFLIVLFGIVFQNKIAR